MDASVVGLGIVLRSLAPALEQVTLQQYRILVLLVTRGRCAPGTSPTSSDCSRPASPGWSTVSCGTAG